MKSCPACQNTFPGDLSLCPRDGTVLVELGGWSEGTIVRGKYRILRKLGEGSMGAVYKALHLQLGEARALKVMSPELAGDMTFVKRFEREAVAARGIQHPNTVRVDGVDMTEDGRPFIVMEFIEGESLKRRIQSRGPLPLLQACSTIKQLALTLDVAHRHGILNLDIRPDNIVFVKTPDGEQVKVLEFGIARVLEPRSGVTAGTALTNTGAEMGTPHYMSPELAMGKRSDELDARSDIYSLGVVMYQVLTGELPFKADTTPDLLIAHLRTPPTPISTLRPDLKIPERLANLAMQCMEKKPERRPASAADLIQEIERAEAEIAVPSTTTSPTQPAELLGPMSAGPPSAPGVGTAAAGAPVAARPSQPLAAATPGIQPRPASQPAVQKRKPARDKLAPGEPRRLAITSFVVGVAGCSTMVLALILARMAGNYARPILIYGAALCLACGITGIVLGYIVRMRIHRIAAPLDRLGIPKSPARIRAERRSLVSMILGCIGVASPILMAVATATVFHQTQGYGVNDARAIESLRTMNDANATYFRTCGQSFAARLTDLGPPQGGKAADCHAAALIEPALAAGNKLGYKLTYIVRHVDTAGKIDAYALRADPVIRGFSGQRSFYTDESGVIRSSASGIATANDGPVE